MMCIYYNILKDVDDLHSREDHQCNMFLYQEEQLINIFQVLHPMKITMEHYGT